MRGHEHLIQMRLNRKAPRIVFVNDYPCKTDWFDNPGDAVTICTHGDDIKTLDIRFLVGLAVSISSPSESRAKALYARCRAIGVATVGACHVQSDKKPWEQTGWAEVYRREAA